MITWFFSLHTRHESQSKQWVTRHHRPHSSLETHRTTWVLFEVSMNTTWGGGVAKHGQYRTSGLACVFRQVSILLTKRSHSDHFYISTVGTTLAIKAASLSKYRGTEGKQVLLLLLNKPTKWRDAQRPGKSFLDVSVGVYQEEISM